MCVSVGDVVQSIAGRDKEKVFLVCKVENKWVFLVNGKERQTTNPKRKNLKHIKLVIKAKNIEMAKKIASGQPVSKDKVKGLLRLQK